VAYLLDTCILSLFARGDPAVQARLRATPPEQVCISVITAMEIEYGLQLNPHRAGKLRPVLEVLMNTARMVGYDRPAALATARIRAALRAQGTPIGPYDALLAGTALANGLVMVTANRTEFDRVAGLAVENWSQR